MAVRVMTGLHSNWCLLIQPSPFTHKHRHMMHENTQSCKFSCLKATQSESTTGNLYLPQSQGDVGKYSLFEGIHSSNTMKSSLGMCLKLNEPS